MKHTAILQHLPSRKKSSTLPNAEEGCHFIRVNSGRIELVSHDSCKSITPESTEKMQTDFGSNNRVFGIRLPNDIRHSWAGSFRVRNLNSPTILFSLPVIPSVCLSTNLFFSQCGHTGVSLFLAISPHFHFFSLSDSDGLDWIGPNVTLVL